MSIRPTNKGFLRYCKEIGVEPSKKHSAVQFNMYAKNLEYMQKKHYSLYIAPLQDVVDYLKEPITITKEDELKHKVEHGSAK